MAGKNAAIAEKLFLREVDRIEEIWIPGTFQWLEKYPKAKRRLRLYEDKLDQLWKLYEEDKASLEEFTRALKAWSGYIKLVLKKRKENQVQKECAHDHQRKTHN